ncbi:MAG: sulfotransferase [Candidatus Hydrogenedentes bacterium]|nr:sulfotransferase [Candidatus Hydrogenedentota bacterium]
MGRFLQMLAGLSLEACFPGASSIGRLTLKRGLMLLAFVPLFTLMQLIHWIAFAIDDLLVRGYRKVEVKSPLFIVGVPRSGTTLLHRLFARDEERFTTAKLWELLFAPSISERLFWRMAGRMDDAIGGPLFRLAKWADRKAFAQLDGIHPTSLWEPEEDYLALTPLCACFLLVLPFPFAAIWRLSRFDVDVPARDRQRVMRFYRRLIQRHLYFHGPDKHYLSKNPSFSSMVLALQQEFPDCHIIGCVRNPAKVVPSLLSSMMQGAEMFDNRLEGGEYQRRLYEMLRFYYEHLSRCLPALPETRHDFVRMEDLCAAPRDVVERVYQRFDWHRSEVCRDRLDEGERKARRFQSGHRYALSQFALDEAQLYQDFGFVFERFGFEVPDVMAPAAKGAA